MRTYICSVTLSILLTAGLAHGEDDMDASLSRLFKALQMEKMQDATIVAMVNMQSQQNPNIQKIKPEFLAFLKENLSWKAIEPDVKSIYRKSFTADEIDELVKFYETPVGKKATSLIPELTAEGARIGQTRIKEKMPAFIKSIQAKYKKATP
jgi:hypothetical protein